MTAGMLLIGAFGSWSRSGSGSGIWSRVPVLVRVLFLVLVLVRFPVLVPVRFPVLVPVRFRVRIREL